MKKQLIALLVTAVVLMFSLAACGGDGKVGVAAKPGMLVITNDTGEDLNELDISVSSEDEAWEDVNLLNGKVLKAGESIDIPLTSFPKDEKYDLAFTAGENSYFKMEVDVKNAGSIIIEKGDFFAKPDGPDGEE